MQQQPLDEGKRIWKSQLRQKALLQKTKLPLRRYQDSPKVLQDLLQEEKVLSIFYRKRNKPALALFIIYFKTSFLSSFSRGEKSAKRLEKRIEMITVCQRYRIRT